jgi:hypothetical protein
VRLSWFGDFFGALPDALKGLWQFGDPGGIGRGWWGILIIIIWGVVLIGAPLFVAKQTHGKHEWVSASMGALAALSVLWWVHGILPSAWIYYVDSNREVLEGAIIPASAGLQTENGFLWWPAGYRLDIASNLYVVIRDLVTVNMMMGGIVLTFWAALRIQRKLPGRTLATGEIKPESGGYK